MGKALCLERFQAGGLLSRRKKPDQKALVSLAGLSPVQAGIFTWNSLRDNSMPFVSVMADLTLAHY